MSTTEYFICLVLYILGLLLCLFWVTIPGLKKKSLIANKPFSLKEWFMCDWSIVLGNLVFGAILMFLVKELVTWKPAVLDYVRWFFVLAGAFGTSLVQSKWGQFSATLNRLLDVKANLSDEVTGGTTTVKETVEKGKDLTGKDVSNQANK